mmetsp:Transcript_4375/g.4503  ORF Transcript_4375/g.4503 Transcript_4375/m.4503 type:complete len:214 (-) Transcript_4375:228-869(-)
MRHTPFVIMNNTSVIAPPLDPQNSQRMFSEFGTIAPVTRMIYGPSSSWATQFSSLLAPPFARIPPGQSVPQSNLMVPFTSDTVYITVRPSTSNHELSSAYSRIITEESTVASSLLEELFLSLPVTFSSPLLTLGTSLDFISYDPDPAPDNFDAFEVEADDDIEDFAADVGSIVGSEFDFDAPFGPMSHSSSPHSSPLIDLVGAFVPATRVPVD